MNIVEQIAKGLQEPLFSEKNDFIDIEFSREIETAQENTKDRIVSLIKSNPKITKQEIMKILNKADGVIKKIGNTKSGYWSVTSEG